MTRTLTATLFGALTLLGGCDIRNGEASSDSQTISDLADAAPPSARSAPGGDFEGVISTNTFMDGQRIEQTLSVKGSRWRFDMEMDGDRASIIRGGDGRVFSLLHDSREWVYFPVVPSSPTDAGIRFEATGERASIAGYSCQYYVMKDPDGLQEGDRACITAEFGFVGVMSTSRWPMRTSELSVSSSARDSSYWRCSVPRVRGYTK